ncbi:hypothetical protein [Fibrobacter sp.]|uniref:hypothetical protein n=1 Tax=Fibrobacter sp. TaxID=35828 RepID=UPI003867D0CF
MHHTKKILKLYVLAVIAASATFVACGDSDTVAPPPSFESSSSSSDIFASSSSDATAGSSSDFAVSSSSVALSSSQIAQSSSSAQSPATQSKEAICGDMWCARRDRESRVNTGFDAGFQTSGYWFDESDTEYQTEGSKITWEGFDNRDCTFADDCFADMIEQYGGISVTQTLKKRDNVSNLYAGIGFNIAGIDELDKIYSADVSNKDGICVVYTSDSDISLEMHIDENSNTFLEPDFPRVTLPPATTPIMKEFTWNDFKQDGTGNMKITGVDAAKNLVSLMFMLRGNQDKSNQLNIMSIGRYGSCRTVANVDSVAQLSKSPFRTWHGSRDYEIKTGYGDGNELSGVWYEYEDYRQNGGSAVRWPIDPPYDNFSEDSFDSWRMLIIDSCKGICGKYLLSMYEQDGIAPFAGIGFHIAGVVYDPEIQKSSLATVDATNMGGICVSYTSDTDMIIQMGFNDDKDAEFGYALPIVSVPGSKEVNTVYVKWSQFKQPSWYNGEKKISGVEAAKSLAAIRFLMTGENGTEGNFNIMSIGPYNRGYCSP